MAKQPDRQPAPRRQQLPESSRKALTWIADRLREGYTGRFELECYGGGVRQLKVAQTFEGNDLDRLPVPCCDGG